MSVKRLRLGYHGGPTMRPAVARLPAGRDGGGRVPAARQRAARRRPSRRPRRARADSRRRSRRRRRSCATSASSEANEPPPRPLRRCFPDRPAWMDAPVAALLDRAAELFDDADYIGALACAEEATRQAPRSVEAHHNRAISLMRLDRLDEARDAIALALALAPDDPETLEAAADLNINQLPPSVDRSALGLEYARRGSRHVGRRDRERIARLALLEGQALIDLGRARRGAAAHRRGAAVVAALRRGDLRARRGAVRAVPVRGCARARSRRCSRRRPTTPTRSTTSA